MNLEPMTKNQNMKFYYLWSKKITNFLSFFSTTPLMLWRRTSCCCAPTHRSTTRTEAWFTRYIFHHNICSGVRNLDGYSITVGARILNTFRFQMVKSCSYVEWFWFPMAFQNQRAHPYQVIIAQWLAWRLATSKSSFSCF